MITDGQKEQLNVHRHHTATKETEENQT